MTSATITKRLREDLNLDVHPSTVAKARKHVLGYNYRRSKCKPSASKSIIISWQFLFVDFSRFKLQKYKFERKE